MELPAVVDSGADMTTFSYGLAKFFGVEPETGLKSEVVGINGKSTTFVHEGFTVHLGGYDIAMRVSFLKTAPPGLGILGRKVIFEHFKVTFDDTAKIIELLPSHTA